MSNRQFDALIFDMGNVLIDWTPERLVRHFTSDESLIPRLTQAVYLGPAWKKLDQGVITEDEAIQAICADLPDTIHPLVVDLVTRWPEANRIDGRMEGLARHLHHQGIRLFLGSNASLRFHTYKHTIKALTYFDGIQISADVHLSKPDSAFFSTLMSTHGCVAERTGFIDDLASNCTAALALGIQTHHYNGDFDALVRWLKDHGSISDETTVEEIIGLG